MNKDCLLEIFDRLDSASLSNVAKCNQQFYELAHRAFRHKHHGRLEISFNTNYSPTESIREFGKSIAVLQPFVKNLICTMPNLSRDQIYKPDTPNLRILRQIVTNIDEKVLLELDLTAFSMEQKHINFLIFKCRMFHRLERLAIAFKRHMNIASSPIKMYFLHDMCPNLRALTVFGNADLLCLQRIWPFLTELNISSNNAVQFITMSDFFFTNPKIEKLTINLVNCYPSPNILINQLTTFSIEQHLIYLDFSDYQRVPGYGLIYLSYTPFLSNHLSWHLTKFQSLESLILSSSNNFSNQQSANVLNHLKNLKKMDLRFLGARTRIKNIEFLTKIITNLRGLEFFPSQYLRMRPEDSRGLLVLFKKTRANLTKKN